MEGLRFVRSEPVLLGAISLDLVAVLFGGAVALLPAIAEDRLGVGAVGLGWLRAAVGIGAGLVTLLLAFKPVTRRVGSIMLIAVGIFGVGTIVLGLTTSYVVAFVALAVLSGADAVSVFIRGTLVPLVTPPDKRGRVLAVETVFIGASNELGAFESGVAGQLLGPAAAIVIGGAVTLGIALSWSKLFPALRAVDRFPEGRREATGSVEPDEQRLVLVLEQATDLAEADVFEPTELRLQLERAREHEVEVGEAAAGRDERADLAVDLVDPLGVADVVDRDRRDHRVERAARRSRPTWGRAGRLARTPPGRRAARAAPVPARTSARRSRGARRGCSGAPRAPLS